MIEVYSLLGFVIVNFAAKTILPSIFPIVLNMSIALSITFLLFGRAFLKMVNYKVWKANIRHFWCCILYAMLLINITAIVIYFSTDPVADLLKIVAIVIMFLYFILLFLFIRLPGFKSKKLYGKVYTVLRILDIVLVTLLIVLDISAIKCTISPMTIMKLVILDLTVITILNFHALRMREYWLHKNALLNIFRIKAKRKEDYKMATHPKVIKDPALIREVSNVLDTASIRIVEVNLIVKQLHDILIENGRSFQEATEIASDFGAAIMKTLMKRKYDFYLLPRSLVKFLQTYNFYKKTNKRTFSHDSLS